MKNRFDKLDKFDKWQVAKIFAFGLLIVGLFLNVAGNTASAQPGTPSDPLVSRNYMERRMAELMDYVSRNYARIGDANVQQVPADFPPPVSAPPAGQSVFAIVRAEPGTSLIGAASTEIILRSGQASIITETSGLVNVTTGTDLTNGQAVPANNLLIVPQADGRGLRFQAVSYLMVRGDFHFAN